MKAINSCHVVRWLLLSVSVTLVASKSVNGYYQPLLDDVIAEDRDALYPITRYAGTGYNYLRGNPEGDFNRGGKDPGLMDTRWILNLTYTQKKEGHYDGRTVAVPDQVEFQPRESCSSQSVTKAYSGQKSYQNELQRNMNLGLSGIAAMHIIRMLYHIHLTLIYLYRRICEPCQFGIFTQFR